MTQLADSPSPLTLSVPARPAGVTEARRALAAYAEQAGAESTDVELAVAEAVGNAVVHAYPGRSPGTVTVSARIEDDGMVVAVADDGVGMRPNPDSPGLGLGLPLIARLSVEYSIRENGAGGTTVRMIFGL